MSKTLYLMRHAKSSWSNPELDDHDRPLNKRGLKNAPEMGRRLKLRNEKPETFLSSSAKRAFDTAGLVAVELEFPVENIGVFNHLYHASSTNILRCIHSLTDNYSSALFIGHNPGILDTANRLTNSKIGHLPTAGLIKISFEHLRWKEVNFHEGHLEYLDFPKREFVV